MTWTRLGDTFHDREDVSSVSRSARLLLIEALGWCNEQLTGGRIPARLLRRVSDSSTLEADTEELVSAGLLVPAEGGVYVMDWLGLGQETVEVVQARKDANARRQREFVERRDLHAKGDHSKCTPNCPGRRRVSKPLATPVSDTVSDPVTNDVTNALATPSLTHPSPLLSTPEGKVEREGTDEPVSADAPTGRRSEGLDVEGDVIVEDLGDDMSVLTLAPDYPDGTLQAAAAARSLQFGVMGGGYDEVLAGVVVRREWADGARTMLAAAVEAATA